MLGWAGKSNPVSDLRAHVLWRLLMGFDYESERLDPAIAYYEGRSATAKRWFYTLQGSQLVASTAVTALAAWPAEAVPRAALAALSAVATLAAGFVALGGWQQLWIRYRATAETLKHERYLHRAGGGPYAAGATTAMLAERCEAVVSSEHSVWATSMERVGEKTAEAGT